MNFLRHIQIKVRRIRASGSAPLNCKMHESGCRLVVSGLHTTAVESGKCEMLATASAAQLIG